MLVTATPALPDSFDLDTAYLVTRAACRLRRPGRGRILNVSSVTGAVMAMRGEVASSVAWPASSGEADINGQVLVVDGGGSVAEESDEGR